MAIPYLTLADPRGAMKLYAEAFGATDTQVMDGPDGSVMHAEIEIGGSRLMLSGEFPGFADAPSGRSPVNFMVYVDDVDAAHAKAVEAGMTSGQEPEDQFWGDRTAKVDDGMGYEWTLATQMEQVSEAELAERIAAYAAAMEGSG